MAKKKQKAYTIDIGLIVRIVIDENLDPNVDNEFDQAVFKAVKKRIKEEGVSFISEGISNFHDDVETPYDPEFDN